jgi:hypothetical protein
VAKRGQEGSSGSSRGAIEDTSSLSMSTCLNPFFQPSGTDERRPVGKATEIFAPLSFFSPSGTMRAQAGGEAAEIFAPPLFFYRAAQSGRRPAERRRKSLPPLSFFSASGTDGRRPAGEEEEAAPTHGSSPYCGLERHSSGNLAVLLRVRMLICGSAGCFLRNDFVIREGLP